ncbi:MAG: hypothetical protein ACO1OF_17045 [Adhaeribacter sp.]
MKIYLLLLSILCLLTNCNKINQPTQKKHKKELLRAESILSYGNSNSIFKFFNDSSYTYEVNYKDYDYEKKDKFVGYCSINKDTIIFFPSRFRFNGCEKAVIKNGFIEFVDAESTFKLKINKSTVPVVSKLDLESFNDYAIFSFNPNLYIYFPKSSSPYDITQSDLIKIDEILKACLKENPKEIERDITEYIKQCMIVINEKGEKEALIMCHCKSPELIKTFEYSMFSLGHDGGDCRFRVKINLTKNTYSELLVNGLA